MVTPSVSQQVGAHVTQDLIDRLREAFPLCPPTLDEADRMIWFKAGQQALITYLEFAHKDYLNPTEGA
jgi:hypothetical protein